MPHIIVEYTRDGKTDIDVLTLMNDLHLSALSTKLFTEKAIKVRVKEYDAALVAGKQANFAHITIYLIDGRDDQAKKGLTERLHETLRMHFADYDSVSVDARDLSRATYTKTTKE